MNEFIDMVTGRLKVSENAARSATGGLLSMIRDNIDDDDFVRLLTAISCSDDQVSAAAPAVTGGAARSLASRVFFSFGLDRVGSTSQIASRLEDLGLNANQAVTLVPMFGQYIGSKVDGRLFQRLAIRVPEIVVAAYDA